MARKIDLEQVYDYRLEIPENTDVKAWEDPEAQDAISVWLRDKGARWPTFPMPGTSLSGGKGLLHIRTLEKVTLGDWASFIATNALPWAVVEGRSGYKGKSRGRVDNQKSPVRGRINKYFLDEFGDPIAGPIWLCAYAGSEPVQMI